ncbi:hypothetical protein ACSSZE_03415 [Acidithiobacillus caldus]
MHIEIVGADLPLAEVSRVVRRMADELGWEAHWDGEKFWVRQGGYDEDGFHAVRNACCGQADRGDH